DFGWVDFHVETAEQMDAAIREAAQRGYLTSCNHPRPEGPSWDFESVESFYCIEVWNGLWRFLNDYCLNFWESHLNRGQRYVAVGGSDTHTLKGDHVFVYPGIPTTYIYVDGPPSPARLLDGIRAGHVFVTESPTGPQLFLNSGQCMMGDCISYPQTKTLPITLDIKDGSGMLLQLVGKIGVMQQWSINSPEDGIEDEGDSGASHDI